jgi:hypothetical protein
MDDNKTLSIALGHLLDFTPIGWWIVVALVVMAVFAWILGSRVFTRWLFHKAFVLLIVIMAVRSLARMFLNE